MEEYKILNHTADIKVWAFGKTKEELFLNMMKGMAEILKPVPDSKYVKRNIKVKSIDLDDLLVDFLSEVLYLSQVNKEVYNNVKFNKFDDTELEGRLAGIKITSLGEEIKAVTYHELKIEQKNGFYQATVLFDI